MAGLQAAVAQALQVATILEVLQAALAQHQTLTVHQ
jgi:hypothetical protein